MKKWGVIMKIKVKVTFDGKEVDISKVKLNDISKKVIESLGK